MSDNPSSAPVLRSQFNFMQPESAKASSGLDHELWSNEHQSAMDSDRLEPTVTYVNALPPTGYARNVLRDNPAYGAHPGIGPAEQHGNPSQYQADGYPSTPRPGTTQSVPIAPGPPRLEPYAPVIPGIPNNRPPGHVPLPHAGAGPSQGNVRLVNSGMPSGENLKDLASRYLHNPGSHVNDLRMRRSRSGAVKVLILLDIDNTV